mgnify:CR=1 FL=1
MASEDAEVERSDILTHLMAKDGQQPRDEPEIAANIGQQLQHMGLTTWSISIHRRLRDALVRLAPQSVLEVGASIGHRTAWLLDAFVREQVPKHLTLVEQGAKFGVILHRLVTRYDALNWTDIVVGEPLQLAADHAAWSIATTISTELSETKFQSSYDAIIIDGPSPNRAELVKTYLPMLSANGVLFTKEPDMPTGEVDSDDEQGMALVNGFNAWMDLIRATQVTHHVAFMPLFGGTLVAWLPMS